MSAASDRVLEYALQVHYGRLPQRDLKGEIVTAWARGAQGAPLDELLPSDLEFEPLESLEPALREASARRRWRRAPWLLLPAAALLLLYFRNDLALPGRAPLGPSTDVAALPEPGPGGRAAPPRPPPQLVVDRSPATADEIAEVQGLFQRMTWKDLSSLQPPLDFFRLRESSRTAMIELVDLLVTRPPLWDALEPELRWTFDETVRDQEVKATVLDFCLRLGSPRAVELVREQWSEHPEVFQVDHLVALAEDGAVELEPELEALLEDPVGFPGQSRVLAAAYFALRGDARGEAILRQGLTELDISRSDIYLPFVAALGLSALGESEIWASAIEGWRTQIDFLLRTQRLPMARAMVISAELFLDLRARGEQPKLGDLPALVAEHTKLRQPQLPTSYEIQAAADALKAR